MAAVKVLVFILETDGLDVGSVLCDVQGIEYGLTPEVGMFVTVADDSVDIASDGAMRLYRPDNGVFDVATLESIIKNYSTPVIATVSDKPTKKSKKTKPVKKD